MERSEEVREQISPSPQGVSLRSTSRFPSDFPACRRSPFSKVEKGPYGRSSKKPTVGRRDDLQWVASATYRRSLLGGYRIEKASPGGLPFIMWLDEPAAVLGLWLFFPLGLDAPSPPVALTLHHLGFGGVGLLGEPDAPPAKARAKVLLLDEVSGVVMGVAVALSVAEVAHQFGRRITQVKGYGEVARLLD